MEIDERLALYCRLERRLGVEHQENKLGEECLELATAIIRYHDGRANIAEMIEEVADVQIVIEQICFFHQSTTFNKRVEEMKDNKLQGMKRRLEKDIRQLREETDTL